MKVKDGRTPSRGSQQQRRRSVQREVGVDQINLARRAPSGQTEAPQTPHDRRVMRGDRVDRGGSVVCRSDHDAAGAGHVLEE